MSFKVATILEFDGAEKYLCLHGNWYTIASAAHLSGDHSIIRNNALQAIQCLLKRHSRLRTRFRIEGQQYLLDILDYDTLDLSPHQLFSVIEPTNGSWQEIVENRCNHNPYSSDGSIDFPLFHFMLVLDSQSTSTSDTNFFHLLLFINHCIADGRSGYILIHEFLTLVTSSDLNERAEPINGEVLPFIHQLIPRPFGPLYPLLFFIAKRIFYRELKKLRHPRIPIKSIPLADAGPSKFHVQPYKYRFLFSSSAPNLYANIREQCHSHHVTINAPLFICLLLAVHHYFPLEDNDCLVPISISMQFDMRPRLPHSPLTSSSVGFFVGVNDMKLGSSFSLQSTRFWSLAQKCMQLTRKQLNRDGIPLSMHAFSDVMKNEDALNQVVRQFPDGRTAELAFSNIGRYPFSCHYQQGQLRLHGIHVANNASVYRTSSMIYVTCAGDKQLDFSLAHEMESDEKAKEFLEYYIRLVEASADHQRCKSETTLGLLLQSVEFKG